MIFYLGIYQHFPKFVPSASGGTVLSSCYTKRPAGIPPGPAALRYTKRPAGIPPGPAALRYTKRPAGIPPRAGRLALYQATGRYTPPGRPPCAIPSDRPVYPPGPAALRSGNNALFCNNIWEIMANSQNQFQMYCAVRSVANMGAMPKGRSSHAVCMIGADAGTLNNPLWPAFATVLLIPGDQQAGGGSDKEGLRHTGCGRGSVPEVVQRRLCLEASGRA